MHFDPATGDAGVLLGNSRVTEIQDQVRAAAMTSVAGLNSKLNGLVALGITADENGHLVINDAKLDDALNGRVAGVTLNDVAKVFDEGNPAAAPASVGAQLRHLLDRLLDPATGRLKVISDGFQANIDDFKAQIIKQNQFLQDETAQLQARFAALESTVSQLQSIGNMLAAQFGTTTKNK